jgi:hypothetical protein
MHKDGIKIKKSFSKKVDGLNPDLLESIKKKRF